MGEWVSECMKGEKRKRRWKENRKREGKGE